MPELLLELLSEDIPARMQTRAGAELKRLVTVGLEREGLAFERVDAYATPRRLALVVDGLPSKQPSTLEERKGPSVDASDAAVEGFAKSVGISRDKLKTATLKKGEYYVADVKQGGRAVSGVIADIVRGCNLGVLLVKIDAVGGKSASLVGAPAAVDALRFR